MQIHVPDPEFTASDANRAHFRSALVVAAAFVAVLIAIHGLGAALGLDLQRYGVRPHAWAGLPGILLAPLLHADAAHLASNALPLLVAGTAMLHLYPDASRFVLPAVYVVPGVAVWLFGRPALHLGASGLVYGLVGYIFVAGVIRRDRRAIAAALLVSFLYGALVWGVFPLKVGVSWETHLAGAAVGAALALAFAGRDIPPRKRYSWEDEADSAEAPAHEVPDAGGRPTVH